MKLICVFVFAYAKSRFSHDETQLGYCNIQFLRYRLRNKKAAKGPMGPPGVPVGRGGAVPVHKQEKGHLAPRYFQPCSEEIICIFDDN